MFFDFYCGLEFRFGSRDLWSSRQRKHCSLEERFSTLLLAGKASRWSRSVGDVLIVPSLLAATRPTHGRENYGEIIETSNHEASVFMQILCRDSPLAPVMTSAMKTKTLCAAPRSVKTILAINGSKQRRARPGALSKSKRERAPKRA